MNTATAGALRHGFADLDEVRLHYVEAGDGPLVVLLHGYPELWLSWRAQIPALAAAGFRVVAPDLRGFGRSDKPAGVRAYDAIAVAGDIAGLIADRGADRAHVAGHDWGAAVAYTLAMYHPEVVERLAILNVPHPRQFVGARLDPRQLARSWYILAFQLPWLPERLIAARGFAWRRRQLAHLDLAPYLREWSQPGTTRSMIGHYRMIARRTPAQTLTSIRPIAAPTLVLWGERDAYLRRELAEPDRADVPALERVVRFPQATHWLHHDEPDAVNTLLVEFFGDDATVRAPGLSRVSAGA